MLLMGVEAQHNTQGRESLVIVVDTREREKEKEKQSTWLQNLWNIFGLIEERASLCTPERRGKRDMKEEET